MSEQAKQALINNQHFVVLAFAACWL